MKLVEALSKIPEDVVVFAFADSHVKIGRQDLINRRQYVEEYGTTDDWDVTMGISGQWLVFRRSLEKLSSYVAYSVPNKYPEHLVQNVRYNIGVQDDETDRSRDFEIQTMSEMEFFKCVCSYHGYGKVSSIVRFVRDVWGIDLEQEKRR